MNDYNKAIGLSRNSLNSRHRDRWHHALEQAINHGVSSGKILISFSVLAKVNYAQPHPVAMRCVRVSYDTKLPAHHFYSLFLFRFMIFFQRNHSN